MPTIKTKWFSSAMAGAPALSGSVGAMIAVLDACLKDGYNLTTLTSLVIASNVATATKAGHGYIVNQVLELAGITGACSALNGNARVTEVTVDTFKFATTGISDQTATGTITAKAAPSGWVKPFSGTNLAVYKSGDALSSQLSIRVDDTVAMYSTALGAESFTDISTPVNSFATNYFKKSNAASAAARPWIIVSDSKTVFLGVAWTDAGVYDFTSFGDFDSMIAADAFNFRLQGLGLSAPTTIGQGSSVSHTYDSSPYQSVVARAQSMIPGGVSSGQASILTSCGMLYAATGAGTLYNFTWSLSGNHGYGANQSTESFSSPSVADNGYHFFPVILTESAAGGKLIRGVVRGLLHVMETLPIATGFSVLSGVENVSEGLVMMVRSAGQVQSNTGPAYIYPGSVIALRLGDF